MALPENELLYVMNVFKYTQLTLNFTSLICISKKFERVSKSDECFY